MSSTSETGHAKNLANLKRADTFIIQAGSIYLPSNNSISQGSINAVYNNCKTAFDNFLSAEAEYKKQTNIREIEFKKLDALIAQIMSHILSLDLDKQTVKDVQATVKKYNGSKGKQTLADAGKAPLAIADPNNQDSEKPQEEESDASISQSQQSFDNKFATAEKIKYTLLSIPTYNPNEPELQTGNIQTFLTNLDAINNTANAATTAMLKARSIRNELFYIGPNSLYYTAIKWRRYMRQILLKSNPEFYKKTAALKFTKLLPRKRKTKKAS